VPSDAGLKACSTLVDRCVGSVAFPEFSPHYCEVTKRPRLLAPKAAGEDALRTAAGTAALRKLDVLSRRAF
jgi:hypothetical protein